MGLIVKIVVLAACVGCCTCDLIRFPDRDVVNVRQGEEVTLECRVPPSDQLDDGRFTWSRPQSAFDSGHAEVTSSDHRRSQLRIRNACADDGGIYRCMYSNGEEEHFNVNVLKPARFLNCPSVQNFTVDDDIVIVCTVDLGNPPARVHWSMDNTPLNGNRYSPMMAGLGISSIQEEDGGEYHCELDQEGFGAQSCEITVRVQPPEGQAPVIAEMDRRVIVKHGDPLVLECMLEAGEEDATITWTTPNNAFPESNLQLDDPSPGAYICIAQNPWGSDIFEVAVIVNIPPLPSMKNHTVRSHVGSNVTLPCDTDLPPNPTPTFTWQRHSDPASGNFPHEPSSARIAVKTNGHLRIHPVAAGDGGVFQCIVENECGRSIQLVELVIIDPPPPSPTPTPSPVTTPPSPTGSTEPIMHQAFIALLVEERCEDFESSDLAQDLSATLERWCGCSDLNVEREALDCLGDGRGRFTAIVVGPQAESVVRQFNDSVERGDVETVAGAQVALCDSECNSTTDPVTNSPTEPEEEEEGGDGALVAVAVVMSVVAVALLGVTMVVLVCLFKVYRTHKSPGGNSVEEGGPPSPRPQQGGQNPDQPPPPPYSYVPTMVPCQHMVLNCPLHPMPTVPMYPQPGEAGGARAVHVPCYLPIMRNDSSRMPQQATPS